MSSPDPIDPAASAPAMDAALPSAVLATILSRLDVRSLLLAASACRCLRSCAASALTFLPAFHLLVSAPPHASPPHRRMLTLPSDFPRLIDYVSCF
jgi:hypothetical protein